MLRQLPLFALSLILLPYLTFALSPHLPIFSSQKEPFTLQAQSGFSVILRYQHEFGDFIPVLSRTRHPAHFRLTNGNLTTANKDVATYYGPITTEYPPPLTPVYLTKNYHKASGAPFLAATVTTRTRKEKLVLTAFGNRESRAFLILSYQRQSSNRD